MTEPTPGTEPPPAPTAKARRAALAAQYSRWVAAEPITAPSGALAYAPGYPVPAANVDDDGRVVLARHQCDFDHPGDERCERFNEPTAWTAPGAARKVSS